MAVVNIDNDLGELIPQFLQGRTNDVIQLEKSIETRDWETIESIGHKLKGNAGSYGFDDMGEIGAKLEIAGRDKVLSVTIELIMEYKKYLSELQVNFV